MNFHKAISKFHGTLARGYYAMDKLFRKFLAKQLFYGF